MKIELKNIKYSEHLSDDSNAFTANLYINSKHAGAVINQGMGGPTNYNGINREGALLIKDAEKYCRALPPMDMSEYYRDGDKHTLPMDLELFIGNLFDEYLTQRDLKQFRGKVNRAMAKSFVIGVPDKSFSLVQFKKPFAEMLAGRDGENVVIKILKDYALPKLEGNNILLNTNFPERLLIAAGLKPNQYQKELTDNAQKETLQSRKKPRIHP